MKTLIYGYFGEDEAMRVFLRNYLTNLSIEDVDFQEDVNFCDTVRACNKSEVMRRFVEASQVGLEYWGQDVFFVGVDLDAEQFSKLESEYEEMRSKLNERHKNKTLIFIPIQCIEHWLWYLKFKQNHPTSNQNVPYERQPRPAAKEEIYGNRRYDSERDRPVVEQLTINMNVDWLESRSASFRHFHNQIKEFLKQA